MWKAIITLMAALAFAGDSLLGAEFGGFDPNRFPIPQENPPLQPVGFAFAIWFPIYLWLIASSAYGLAKHPRSAAWDKFRAPLIISLIIGTPWIRVAQVSPVWSTVMIWAMLLFAVLALFRAPKEAFGWARAPLGLYAGWLAAASAVGSSVLFSGYGLLPAHTSAVVFLFVGLALAVGVLTQLPYPTPTFSLAFQWALVGVVIKSIDMTNIGMSVMACIGIVVVAYAQNAAGKKTVR